MTDNTQPEALRLAASRQAGAVPQGWKAVPVNPTPEMWKAAKSVPDPNPPYPPHYGLVWDAMLAASPTPTAEQAAPKAEPGEPPGIQALMCVISSLHSLRDIAHFSDEEGGELMSALCALRDWAYAQTAAFQPAPAPLNDDVVKDAALWHWLAEYLVGTRTDLDDEIVASKTVNDLRKLVEAAIKQGGKA